MGRGQGREGLHAFPVGQGVAEEALLQGAGRLQGRGGPGAGLLQKGLQEGPLAGEVVVEGPLGQAQLRGQLVQAGGGVAALGQGPPGRLEDAGPGVHTYQ